MGLPISKVLIATLLSSLAIFLTRAFPFLVFSNNKVPKSIQFIEKYIPPMIMAILTVYCFKDASFSKSPFALPEFICALLTIALHLWKKNPMISIFGSTALYLFLIRIM